VKARAAGATRRFTVEASPARERDWPARKDGRLKERRPPRRLDLREDRPWYSVRNQGQTGSCVGWALADSVMRWQLVEGGRLQPHQSLSARFIWMASKEYRAQRMLLDEWQPSTFLEEAPTTAKDALEVARRYGAVTDRTLPWSGPLHRGPVDDFFSRAAELRIRAFHSLDHDDFGERERQWRQWLHQHGPVLLVVEVDRTFVAARKAAAIDAFRPRRTPYLHACALVGYDESGFILRNSWGRRWADGGDARVTPRWLAAGAQESYGVVF
jgi:hypothetical protein